MYLYSSIIKFYFQINNCCTTLEFIGDDGGMNEGDGWEMNEAYDRVSPCSLTAKKKLKINEREREMFIHVKMTARAQLHALL